MRAVTSGNVKVTGDLLANGKPYDGSIFTGFANYVMQDDRLFEVLTPRECFIFAASLKTKSDYKTKMEMAE
jgi:ABC-type multidrug transport system ATPase subunit